MANRFSKLVSEHRRRVGLTQEDLAAAMHVTQSTVTKWERHGIASMPPAGIRRLAGVLQIEPLVVAEALGYPIGDGSLSPPGDLDEAGLPPLRGEDLDKVLEYAWLLYGRKRQTSQPLTRRRAGGGPNAA